MPELDDPRIKEVHLSQALDSLEVPLTTIKFVLDSVIDLLEEVHLTGEQLKWAGQILRDVEDLRSSL